jgi:hypothetical protein
VRSFAAEMMQTGREPLSVCASALEVRHRHRSRFTRHRVVDANDAVATARGAFWVARPWRRAGIR